MARSLTVWLKANKYGDLLKACKRQLRLIEAMEKVIVSYRLGTSPSEKTLRDLEDKEAVIAAAKEAIQESNF
jgi:hypothetical protein